jgi:hypothetical protein
VNLIQPGPRFQLLLSASDAISTKSEVLLIPFQMHAWAGGIKPGDPHYYRVQTPLFLIELDDTQDNANHIHSVWRDFNGDFGGDLLKVQYESSHRIRKA